jgi:tetratricopeptide (TPR) repeat protein
MELYLEQYLTTHQGFHLDRALAAGWQAARLEPDKKDYFYALGSLYSHRGDLDSAEVVYNQALSLDPDLAAAYERLGNLYKYQGRFAEAEKAYQKRLQLRPQDAEAITREGTPYENRGCRGHQLQDDYHRPPQPVGFSGPGR